MRTSAEDPPVIHKGEWFTFCCWRDLEQAAHDIEFNRHVHSRVYPSLSAALEYELRHGEMGCASTEDEDERDSFLKWLHGPEPYWEELRQAVLSQCPEYRKRV